jgi:hypothetical protein
MLIFSHQPSLTAYAMLVSLEYNPVWKGDWTVCLYFEVSILRVILALLNQSNLEYVISQFI